MQTHMEYTIKSDSDGYSVLKRILTQDNLRDYGIYADNVVPNDSINEIECEWFSGATEDGVLRESIRIAKLIPEKELVSFSMEGMLSYDSSNEADLFVIECKNNPIDIKYSSKHYDMDDYGNPDFDDNDEIEEFYYEDEIESVRKKKRKNLNIKKYE